MRGAIGAHSMTQPEWWRQSAQKNDKNHMNSNLLILFLFRLFGVNEFCASSAQNESQWYINMLINDNVCAFCEQEKAHIR